MKIATTTIISGRRYLFPFIALFGLCITALLSSFTGRAWAVDNVPVALPMMTNPGSANGTASPVMPMTNPAAAFPPASHMMNPGMPAPSLQAMQASAESADKKNDKNLKNLENNITDSSADIMKRLGTSPSDMTLDDLNAAKIVLAKIDALTDIEKHLTELNKARDERVKESTPPPPPVVPQIPVTALTPPSLPLPPPVVHAEVKEEHHEHAQPAVVVPAALNLEVDRIGGINGHYTAVLSVPNGGPTKIVHVGDKLPDGSEVANITATEVDLRHGDKTERLHIKGIDRVYGRSL